MQLFPICVSLYCKCVLQVKWTTLEFELLLDYHRMSLETDLFHSFGYHEPSSSEDFPLFLGTAQWETATWFNHNIIFQDSTWSFQQTLSVQFEDKMCKSELADQLGGVRDLGVKIIHDVLNMVQNIPAPCFMDLGKNRWRSYRVFATIRCKYEMERFFWKKQGHHKAGIYLATK